MHFRNAFRVPYVFITAHALWDGGCLIAAACVYPNWKWLEMAVLALAVSLLAQTQLVGICLMLARPEASHAYWGITCGTGLLFLAAALTLQPVVLFCGVLLGLPILLPAVAFAATAASAAYGRRQFHRFPAKSAPPVEPWQFELRHLFWAPLMVAVPLGVTQFYYNQDKYPVSTSALQVLLTVAAAIAGLYCGLVWGFLVSTVIPIWAAFQFPRPFWGFVAHVAVLLCCGSLMLNLLDGPLVAGSTLAATWDTVLGIAVVYASLTTGTLCWARRCGYRLIHLDPDAVPGGTP